MKKFIALIMSAILAVSMLTINVSAASSSKVIDLDINTTLSILTESKLSYGYTSDDGSEIVGMRRKKVSDGWEYILTPKKEGIASIQIGSDFRYTINVYEPIEVEVGQSVTYDINDVANFSYKRTNKNFKVSSKKVWDKRQFTFIAKKAGTTKVKVYSGNQKVYTFYLKAVERQIPEYSLKMIGGECLDFTVNTNSSIYALTPEGSPVSVTGISDGHVVNLYANNSVNSSDATITVIDANTSMSLLKLNVSVEPVRLSYIPTLSIGTGFMASISGIYSGSAPNVYYVSSNTSVLTVDEQGNCIANGYGTATLYACSMYTNEILDYGVINVI